MSRQIDMRRESVCVRDSAILIDVEPANWSTT